VGAFAFGVVADLGLEDPAGFTRDPLDLPAALRLAVGGHLERLPAAGALHAHHGQERQQEGAVVVGPQRIGGGDRPDQLSVGPVFVLGDGSGFPAEEPGAGLSDVAGGFDFTPELRISAEAAAEKGMSRLSSFTA
jgi:hypothetical protein